MMRLSSWVAPWMVGLALGLSCLPGSASPLPERQATAQAAGCPVPLIGVTAIAATDVWALGYGGPGGGPLSERWNGARWQAVPFAAGVAGLTAIAGRTSDDIWAVGYGHGTPPQKMPLPPGARLRLQGTAIEHWDGRRWRVVPSGPDPGGYLEEGYLAGVAALSRREAWAVGRYAPGGDHNALILRWDGARWRRAPAPTANSVPHQTGGDLYAVAAVSAHDVWAAGGYIRGGKRVTLIEHWNGAAWRIVPSPNAVAGTAPHDNVLTALAAVSSRDVWAVGYAGDDPLVEHWNGRRWRIVPGPRRSRGGAHLTLSSIAAVSSRDVWAVGEVGAAAATLIEHWDGTAWRIVPSPNRGGASALSGVAAVSTRDVWAVGYSAQTRDLENPANPRRPLIERWDGAVWRIVPSACG